jgi:hypothetical protein
MRKGRTKFAERIVDEIVKGGLPVFAEEVSFPFPDGGLLELSGQERGTGETAAGLLDLIELVHSEGIFFWASFMEVEAGSVLAAGSLEEAAAVFGRAIGGSELPAVVDGIVQVHNGRPGFITAGKGGVDGAGFPFVWALEIGVPVHDDVDDSAVLPKVFKRLESGFV